MKPGKRGKGRPPKPNNKIPIREGKPFRFFKIILPFILEQNRLSIPEIIARRLNYRFPTVATLCTPTGHAWKVSISKSENKLYFTLGWEEFMKHNSIAYGFFLVFEYTGLLNFRVRIFDLSCCEVDYQCNTNNQSKTEEPVQVKEEDKTSLHDGDIIKTKYETPSFDFVLRESNLTGNYLYVPMSFARKYMTRKSVKLEADDGRTWQIGCSKGKHIVRLIGTGLKEFMNDNDLAVGDHVTFQFGAQKDDHIMLKFFRK